MQFDDLLLSCSFLSLACNSNTSTTFSLDFKTDAREQQTKLWQLKKGALLSPITQEYQQWQKEQ